MGHVNKHKVNVHLSVKDDDIHLWYCGRALAPHWHHLSKENKGLLDSTNIKADIFSISDLGEPSRSCSKTVMHAASNKSEWSTENIPWFSKLLLKVSWEAHQSCHDIVLPFLLHKAFLFCIFSIFLRCSNKCFAVSSYNVHHPFLQWKDYEASPHFLPLPKPLRHFGNVGHILYVNWQLLSDSC